MAQPDEVWNFQKGDGLEKAIALVSITTKTFPSLAYHLRRDGHVINVSIEGKEYIFQSSKDIEIPISSDFHF